MPEVRRPVTLVTTVAERTMTTVIHARLARGALEAPVLQLTVRTTPDRSPTKEQALAQCAPTDTVAQTGTQVLLCPMRVPLVSSPTLTIETARPVPLVSTALVALKELPARLTPGLTAQTHLAPFVSLEKTAQPLPEPQTALAPKSDSPHRWAAPL